MAQVLSLAKRPETFSQMVGAEKLIRKLRGHFQSGRVPQACMFVGQTGSGKTTVARILALAVQCTHQEIFGDPCKECRAKKKSFDITEINASDVKGIDLVRMATDGYNYKPRPNSRRRVYILDEAHMMSTDSQNYLLKPFEDCPKTTMWIICTTQPDRIIETLRSRCTATYAMPIFGVEETTILVKKALKWAGSDRSSSDIAEALLEAGVDSPRLILNAVEKYVTDRHCSAEDAAKEGLTGVVDVHALVRSVIKADWRGAAQWLSLCSPADAKTIRSQLLLYLSKMLINDHSMSDRNEGVAKAIKALANVNYLGDKTQMAIIAAVVFDVTCLFKTNVH